jgi:hypothetical protein
MDGHYYTWDGRVRDKNFVDDQRRIESEWEDEDGWNRLRGVFISLVLSR